MAQDVLFGHVSVPLFAFIQLRGRRAIRSQHATRFNCRCLDQDMAISLDRFRLQTPGGDGSIDYALVWHVGDEAGRTRNTLVQLADAGVSRDELQRRDCSRTIFATPGKVAGIETRGERVSSGGAHHLPLPFDANGPQTPCHYSFPPRCRETDHER